MAFLSEAAVERALLDQSCIPDAERIVGPVP